MSEVRIFLVSFVHTLLWSSIPLDLVDTGPWRFPSCSILFLSLTRRNTFSVCAMTVSFSFSWLASAYLPASNDQIWHPCFISCRSYMDFTWVCLQNIQRAPGFPSYHRILEHICHVASAHTWLSSWVPLDHGYSLHWRFPSYSSLWVYLNDKDTLLCLLDIQWDRDFHRCQT